MKKDSAYYERLIADIQKFRRAEFNSVYWGNIAMMVFLIGLVFWIRLCK